MATSYYGNDLSAIQAAMSAEAADAAAIERARIAKDAQNMASFFNATSNRQRVEEDRRRADLENAYRYFALDTQGTLERSKQQQEREMFNQELELRRQAIEAQKKRDELQFDPKRIASNFASDPRIFGELMAITADVDAHNAAAKAAANDANLALDALKEELPRKKQEGYEYFTWGKTDEDQAQQKADEYFKRGLASIPVGLGKERSGLIEYNPLTQRFEPISRNIPSGIPSQMPAPKISAQSPAPSPPRTPLAAQVEAPIGRMPWDPPITPVPWDLSVQPPGPVIEPPRTNRVPPLRRIYNPANDSFIPVQ